METVRTLDRVREDEVEISVADEGTSEQRLEQVLNEIMKLGYICLN